MIGSSNFGIDEASYFRAVKEDGKHTLDVHVKGDKHTFANLSETALWDWALYPPVLYIHSAPCERTVSGELAAAPDTRIGQNENYDAGLYLMEHHAIRDVRVAVAGSSLHIHGTVDLIGKPTRFELKWIRRTNPAFGTYLEAAVGASHGSLLEQEPSFRELLHHSRRRRLEDDLEQFVLKELDGIDYLGTDLAEYLLFAFKWPTVHEKVRVILAKPWTPEVSFQQAIARALRETLDPDWYEPELYPNLLDDIRSN